MKIEDWVVDFAKELKVQLNSDWREDNVAEVAERISDAALTAEQRSFIWNYLQSNGYDRRKGLFIICQSDNSAFLKVVAMVKDKVEGK